MQETCALAGNISREIAVTLTIRNFHESDLCSLYEICLQTGANGEDATGLVDGQLPGHIYAAPYVILEPEQCFIVVRFGAPVGYILGTRDSAEFSTYFNEVWRPPLLARYPVNPGDENSYQAQLTRRLHDGYKSPELAVDYPAHLHIDILPAGQGQGMGALLIEMFLNRLRSLGTRGVHFGVSRLNRKAIGFYQYLGFEEIAGSSGSIVFGMTLQ